MNVLLFEKEETKIQLQMRTYDAEYGSCESLFVFQF